MRMLACAAAAAVLLLAACGDSDDGPSGSDEEQLTAVAEDLANATAESDGETACGLLTDRYREEVEEGSQLACEESFEPLPGQKAGDAEYPQIVKVNVTGDTADVAVRPAKGIVCGYTMVNEDGEWHVDANVCFGSDGEKKEKG